MIIDEEQIKGLVKTEISKQVEKFMKSTDFKKMFKEEFGKQLMGNWSTRSDINNSLKSVLKDDKEFLTILKKGS